MPAKQDVAVRKRQQIAKANRLMFIWVAVASAIIGATAVVTYSLSQKLLFNERVLAAKNQTIKTLDHNNSVASQLKDNVAVLNTNGALKLLSTPADTEPAQVVLDALPATANSAALGASLQSNQLLGQPGVTIESLTVTPVAGVEDGGTGVSATTSTTSSSNSSAAMPVAFQFSVSVPSGQESALKEVLQHLERSIRATTITTIKIEQQGGKTQMTASGNAYYLPAMKVQLGSKLVK